MEESTVKPVVQIKPYDPHWIKTFESESLQLKSILGENCINIHHIGSTSIPNLAAKPIIDMIPVVKNILQLDSDEIIAKMKTLGYVSKGENGIPLRRFYYKENDNLRVRAHLHIFESWNPEIELHLKFREYLIHNPETKKEYETLKYLLASKFPTDMSKYCYEKSKFIHEKIGNRIPFNDITFRNCFTRFEWNEFGKLLNYDEDKIEALRFKEAQAADEQNTDTEFYFTLYKGYSKIISAIHLKLLIESPTSSSVILLEIIGYSKTIDATLDHKFKSLIELWAKQKWGVDKVVEFRNSNNSNI